MDDKMDKKDLQDERSRTPVDLQQLSPNPSSKPSNNTSDSPNKQKGTMPINISRPVNANSDNCLPSSSRDQNGLMTDNDGKPIPLDKILHTANTMSSMMMAHKIALEDDFRLEPGMDISGPLMSLSPIIGSSPKSKHGTHSGEPSLQSKVKDIMHEAYWDLFKSEVETHGGQDNDGKKFDISKQLLNDVKLKILELLLPQHSRLKQDLEDKLDPQIIDQLSQVGSLNLLNYSRYILEVLSKLCAPVRDDKLKELSEATDLVQLYRGIMELLEMMRLDFANFTLNRFKPHIKAHSQEYEREKFNEILKQQKSIGIDGLEYTKIWLNRAVEKVDSAFGISDIVNETNQDVDNQELSSTSIMNSERASTDEASSKHDKILKSDIINKVLNSGYCELLEWSTDKQKLYPETLLFDEATFKSLGEQYKVLVMASSILLTTFAFLNKFKLHDDNRFKTTVKSHVITLLTATYDEKPTNQSGSSKSTPIDDNIDQLKLETIATCLIKDIKEKLVEVNKEMISVYEDCQQVLYNQILDISSQSNRIRELARRRIVEFVETLLSIDVKHQQKKFSSKHVPPVNIPLALNCLSDELTLTMAQLVKIIRYNRKVFYNHYENIIVEIVSKMI